MLYRIISIVAILILYSACHQPKPRKPVSYKTGSFLDESLKRNQALLKAEEKAIFKIIKNDSLNTYYNSSDGFWYHYVIKNTKDTITPQFGDQVTFTYNLRTFSEDTIYTMAEIGYRELCHGSTTLDDWFTRRFENHEIWRRSQFFISLVKSLWVLWR